MKKFIILYLIVIVMISVSFYFITNIIPVNFVILREPFNTEFYVGDEADMTGLEFGLVLHDDTIRPIDISSVNILEYDNSEVGTVMIIFEYRQFVQTIDFTIKEIPTIERQLIGIEMHQLPTKTVYYVGEQIQMNGASIIKRFNDSSYEIVAVTRHNIRGFDSSQPALELVITVFYNDPNSFNVFETTFTVQIIEPEV